MEYRMSRKELKAMDIFWDTRMALSAREFMQKAPFFKEKKANAVLRSLLEKYYIRIVGVRQRDDEFEKLYLPCISKIDYLRDRFQDFSEITAFDFSIPVIEEDEWDRLQDMLYTFSGDTRHRWYY